ncbi:hypothetical protein L3Q82_023469 [Scortum barcoo]|uniref:Uncharacterized protein n=1 Tax=Scortum barcoo TaxID=214431 RepID=A0ACB8WYF9_9TELE|nr:hypothetical protein L3Q82_023469 [Scortum barcoo]
MIYILKTPPAAGDIMAYHPEFERAGQRAGLQVWRVENMELVPVPESLYGGLYTGDVYVVLYSTNNRRGTMQYHLHYWQGSECSQDEDGAAAILAVQMDDFLQGAPVQFLEVQGHESSTFTWYFKTGLKYMSGGVASGFKHVVTNEVEVQRLLQVKGQRLVRVTEVPVSWESFNHGDSFILDLGEVRQMGRWRGETGERETILNMSLFLQEIIQWSGSHSNRFERLKATMVSKGIHDDERCGRAKLLICDEGAEPERMLEVLGEKLELPESNSDTNMDASHRKQAQLYKVQTAVYNQKGLEPAQTGFRPPSDVLKVPQLFFKDWRDPDDTVGMGTVCLSNQIAKIEKVNQSASSFPLACQKPALPQSANSSDRFRLTCQSSTNQKPWQRSTGWCTEETERNRQGVESSQVEVRVVQGKEPTHFMSLFGDQPMMVYKGGTSRDSCQSEVADTRLFQILTNPAGHSRAIHTEPELHPQQTLCLVQFPNGSHVFQFLKALCRVCKRDAFWDALGGQEDYCHSPRPKDKMLQQDRKLPGLSTSLMEEVPGELTQDDLTPDDVMILDTWDQASLFPLFKG